MKLTVVATTARWNLVRIFCAYPASAPTVDDVFRTVASNFRSSPKNVHIWPENDAVGRPLIDPILEHIDESDCVVCDLTRLNFNVSFEAGYAIAKKKRVFFTINAGVENDSRILSSIGIFDTFGYMTYENSRQLTEAIGSLSNKAPLFVDYRKDFKNPVYIVELPRKSDFQTRIISRVKKAYLRYRSFNAQEHVRLSGTAAIEHVASSSGVIVPLAAKHVTSADIHNIRAAFVAGLAFGLDKPLLLLQEYDGPAPLDVRDMVRTFRSLDDINEFVADFSRLALEELQANAPPLDDSGLPLTDLILGDPMAENEMTTLAEYYLTTDEFLRVSRGEANLVVGRKGMGKTALFIQLRDRIRRDKANVVVDLKPEGYQLRKLREDIFDVLTQGSFEHLVVAFWEYLLYLEITNKLLEKDAAKHKFDHNIRAPYEGLMAIQSKVRLAQEGDFSERLFALVEDILKNVKNFELKKNRENKLSTANITELIHSHFLPELRAQVIDYLKLKKSVWILFDNLDKGWPVQGIDQIDAVILRSLIDAGKKIKRELTRADIDAQTVVFVRNDVYEILMQNTADFGKEIRVQLDWSDRDLLKSLTGLRLSSGRVDFDQVWSKYFDPLYKGEYSFNYIVERSLMRPRNIIKMMFHAKGFAINMRHQRILESDLTKALHVYSNDVLEEADEELSDIEPRARGLIYNFIGEKPNNDLDGLKLMIMEFGLDEDVSDKIIEYLLYFGFFGVNLPGEEPRFIYNFNYNMRLLNSWISKNYHQMVYVLNPAFWPALEIDEK